VAVEAMTEWLPWGSGWETHDTVFAAGFVLLIALAFYFEHRKQPLTGKRVAQLLGWVVVMLVLTSLVDWITDNYSYGWGFLALGVIGALALIARLLQADKNKERQP
jgi:peptidoglycan/LPS O-acetylase OafA/YrhL